MNARQALVCPACGVLNRRTWEFCAKCGESLEGAARRTEQEQGARSRLTTPVSGVPSVLVLGITLLAVGAFAVMGWQYAREAPPPSRPDPAMFTIATLPPQPPEPPAPPSARGAESFDEARRLSAAGDLEGARDELAAALVADGSNARYRAAYGRTLWALGARQQALEEFRVAARLDTARQIDYARALDIAGDRPMAVAEYEAVLAQSPDSAVVQEELGRLLYRWGKWDDAASHLERAVAARPDDPVLKQELGWAFASAGEQERAAQMYREVLESSPRAAVSRGLLADNLFDQGQKDEAMALVQEGLELDPEAPLLQRQLGSLLERNGSPAEAAVAYRRYAQLAPNAPDARELSERAARLEAGGGEGDGGDGGAP